MSEESDPESKTEAPSARRLQHARDEGQLPLGKDAAAVAGLAAGMAALTAVAPGMRDAFAHLVRFGVEQAAEGSYRGLFSLSVRPFLLALAGTGAAAAGAALVTLAQTQGGFWSHLAMPDLSRLANTEALAKLASKDFWVDLGLALLKVLAVTAAGWPDLRAGFLSLQRYLLAPVDGSLTGLYGQLGSAGVKVVTAMAVVAGVDLAVTRLRFTRKMRMTKEEAKREYREDEGDPLIRSRRRRAHREFAKGRAALEVPRADALVVNPTHIAIAIRYRKGEDAAPRVTAKGKGKAAEIMRELARENGVPIVKDIPLARLLHKKVKVGKAVPADSYKAVAAVLAFVYRLTGKAPGTGSSSSATGTGARP